jgi:hypothetical protein
MSSARTRGTTPDLFSHTSVREPSAPPQNQPSSSHVVAKAVNNLTSPRHVLPKNLAAAVKQLGDGELDQLLWAVLDEKNDANKSHLNSGWASGKSTLLQFRWRAVRSTPCAQRSKLA